MKNIEKTIVATLALTGALVFGGQANAATKKSNNYTITTSKQYNNNLRSIHMKSIKQSKFIDDNYDEYISDLRSIRQYQKAAINFGDSKTFNAGNKAWKYVVKDYANNMYSTKFNITAQAYLINYRLYFQRDTNPYYLNKQNQKRSRTYLVNQRSQIQQGYLIGAGKIK